MNTCEELDRVNEGGSLDTKVKPTPVHRVEEERKACLDLTKIVKSKKPSGRKPKVDQEELKTPNSEVVRSTVVNGASGSKRQKPSKKLEDTGEESDVPRIVPSGESRLQEVQKPITSSPRKRQRKSGRESEGGEETREPEVQDDLREMLRTELKRAVQAALAGANARQVTNVRRNVEPRHVEPMPVRENFRQGGAWSLPTKGETRVPVAWMGVPTPHGPSALHEEILKLGMYVNLHETEVRAREELLRRLTFMAGRLFGPDVEVFPIGSYATCLSTFTSDVDVVIRPKIVDISEDERTYVHSKKAKGMEKFNGNHTRFEEGDSSDEDVEEGALKPSVNERQKKEPSSGSSSASSDMSTNMTLRTPEGRNQGFSFAPDMTSATSTVNTSKKRPRPTSSADSNNSQIETINTKKDSSITNTEAKKPKAHTKPVVAKANNAQENLGFSIDVQGDETLFTDEIEYNHAPGLGLPSGSATGKWEHVSSESGSDTDAEQDPILSDIGFMYSAANINESSVAVQIQKKTPPKMKAEAINKLKIIDGQIRRERWTPRVLFIKQAKVPIIKLDSLPGGISCDLQWGGPPDAKEIQAAWILLVKLWPNRFQPLAMILKTLLHQLGLDDPSIGGVGSHHLCVMVAHHLSKCSQHEGADLGQDLMSFLHHYSMQENLNRNTRIEYLRWRIEFQHYHLTCEVQSAFREAHRRLHMRLQNETSSSSSDSTDSGSDTRSKTSAKAKKVKEQESILNRIINASLLRAERERSIKCAIDAAVSGQVPRRPQGRR